MSNSCWNKRKKNTYMGWGGGAQGTMMQLCNWLSAPGSPAAAVVIWLWRRRFDFPKVNCNSGKAQHGSQTSTSKRCGARLADISRSHPPGGGLRCGGCFGSAPGHHPDHGGFLRLPWLVRTEAERTAVRDSLDRVPASRHVIIHRIIAPSVVSETPRHRLGVK